MCNMNNDLLRTMDLQEGRAFEGRIASGRSNESNRKESCG